MKDPLSVNKFLESPNSYVKTGTSATPVVNDIGTRMVGGGPKSVPPQSTSSDLVAVGVGGGGIGVVVTDGPDVVAVAAPAYVCAYDGWYSSKKWCNSTYGWGNCWSNWCSPWSCGDGFSLSFSWSSGYSSFSYSSGCWPWYSWSSCHSSYYAGCYTPIYVCSPYYTYRPWYWDAVYVGPVYKPCLGPWWARYTYTPVVYYVDEPAPVYSSPTVIYSSATPPAPMPTMGETWNQLSYGLDRNALEGFAALMQHADAEGLGPGLSTLGYGLANAMMGYHQSAAAAVRSAVRRDPQMLRLVPRTEALTTRLRDLADVYKQRTSRTDQEFDSLFMIAAINTILGDDAAAFYAANQARSRGDSDDSTTQLAAMLGNSLSQDLYH